MKEKEEKGNLGRRRRIEERAKGKTCKAPGCERIGTFTSVYGSP